MSRRAAAALVLCLATTLPIRADFASVARAIDAKAGVKRTWIPLLGIARTMVRLVEPNGVHDFQLAVFRGAERLEGRELQSLLREKIGPGFKPLVQVWSRGKGEWSFIYARPASDGDRVELVILARDSEDTVLVRVDLDASALARELDDPRGVTRVARR